MTEPVPSDAPQTDVKDAITQVSSVEKVLRGLAQGGHYGEEQSSAYRLLADTLAMAIDTLVESLGL